MVIRGLFWRLNQRKGDNCVIEKGYDDENFTYITINIRDG